MNLTQMTIISNTVGKNPLEEMEQPSVNKRVRNAVLGCNLEKDRMNFVHFQGKPFNTTVIQVCAPTINAEETEVDQFSEDLHQFLDLTINVLWCPFHHRGLECKSRKTRDTWSKRQVWPWSTKWKRAKANKFCQENILVTAKSLL